MRIFMLLKAHQKIDKFIVKIKSSDDEYLLGDKDLG